MKTTTARFVQSQMNDWLCEWLKPLEDASPLLNVGSAWGVVECLVFLYDMVAQGDAKEVCPNAKAS